jgi:hypothetical protein
MLPRIPKAEGGRVRRRWLKKIEEKERCRSPLFLQ